MFSRYKHEFLILVTRVFIPSLRDPAQQVRKTAGLVMTHLILKDMVKVKGQVSEMAVLLIDPVPQIAALAKNFFNELSHKVREAAWGFVGEMDRSHFCRLLPASSHPFPPTGQCYL